MADRVGVVLTLAAVIAAAAMAESSPARRDVATKGSAGSTKFVSKRYGYEMRLAGQWKAEYAIHPWTGDFPQMDSGEVDVLSTSGDRFFIVAATPLPRGTTLRKWERRHAYIMCCTFPYCQPARAFRSTKLGGVAAREFQERCLVHDAIVVVALHRGRGYTFQFVSPKENTLASDRAILDEGRRTFRFTSTK